MSSTGCSYSNSKGQIFHKTHLKHRFYSKSVSLLEFYLLVELSQLAKDKQNVKNTARMEFGFGFLPIIWSVFSLGAPVVSYAVSVWNGHVYPFLPAISVTGSKSPEANLFSMLLNLSTFVSLFNIYVRYYQCDLQIRRCMDIKDTLMRLNMTGLLFAGFSIFGGVVVSNFQSNEVNIQLAYYCKANL